MLTICSAVLGKRELVAVLAVCSCVLREQGGRCAGVYPCVLGKKELVAVLAVCSCELWKRELVAVPDV